MDFFTYNEFSGLFIMLSLKGQILRRFKPSLRVLDKPRLHKKVYYSLTVQPQKDFWNGRDGKVDY